MATVSQNSTNANILVNLSPNEITEPQATASLLPPSGYRPQKTQATQNCFSLENTTYSNNQMPIWHHIPTNL